MLSKGLSSCEDVASGLSTFYEQTHLYHLQTKSYAEHMAMGALYEFIGCFKDDCLEKVMGYKGIRLNAFPIESLKNYSPGASMLLVNELKQFASDLSQYAIKEGMPSVDDISQDLSGQAAKTAYLLTLT